MSFKAALQSLWDRFFEKRGHMWESLSSGRKTAAGEPVSEDTALNFSAVWCATRVLCGTGALLPLPVYRGLDGEERAKAREHILWRLLNKAPNRDMTAYNFRSVMWQWQVNWGNAFAEIVREGDDREAPIMSLWPIHPSRVTVDEDEDGFVAYQVYDPREHANVPVPSWKILHIPSIITHDGIVGQGVIARARETIAAGIAAEKYGANWFGGAGVPRVVIEHAATWTDEARKAFRQEWDDIHSGSDGHRVAILQGGATAKPLSLSANDSQFLETRQFEVEEIARWYGIPPHLLQHLLRATFNNVEELGRNFVQYSLVPWLELWEQAIWQKLLTEDEQESLFVEHNVDALQRGNLQARSAYYQAMTAAALMTRNECRKLENLDPVEGGDTFLVQGAMVPLDGDGKPESRFVSGSASSTPQGMTEPDDDSEPIDTQAIISSLHRVVAHDLSRLLTKETKAIADFARRPEAFLQRVEAFYDKQTVILRDELTETFGALTRCGISVSADAFVTGWIREGLTLVVEASGHATPDSLPQAIERTLESRTWTERPLRAVEGVRHATAGV